MNEIISPTTPGPVPSKQPSAPIGPVNQHPGYSFPPPPEPPKKSRSHALKSAFSTLAILLVAPLLALTITAYIFQSYEVDGPSMQTTLQNRDRLIIWKVGRTWARITNNAYIPNRGDVIVFVKKGLYETDSGKEKQLIKRVVALPGERVTVRDSKVTVYNKEFPNGFNPDTTLPYGKAITTTEGNIDVTVPAGEVFVCGDNRSNSLDSRYFGPIPAEDIVGQLIARILPLSEAERF